MNTQAQSSIRSSKVRTAQHWLRTLAIAAFALVQLTGVAHADDRTGRITELLLNTESYMGLRVRMEGVSSFCGGGATNPQLAFLARDHALYESALSMLMAAQLAGRTVLITSSKDGNYCRITGVRLQ